MKKYNIIILLLFVCILLGSGSCENREGQYYITIQNNSDKEVIFMGSTHSSVTQDTQCIKPTTNFEYVDFIYSNTIKPFSSKKKEIDRLVEHMQTYNLTWSLGIFNRIDMDTMSCEEFKQKYPLKKEWQATLADMEACSWTLVYTPEEE
jgi:hypothetical protein